MLLRVGLACPLEISEIFVLPPPQILLYSQGSKRRFNLHKKILDLCYQQSIYIFNSYYNKKIV